MPEHLNPKEQSDLYFSQFEKSYEVDLEQAAGCRFELKKIEELIPAIAQIPTTLIATHVIFRDKKPVVDLPPQLLIRTQDTFPQKSIEEAKVNSIYVDEAFDLWLSQAEQLLEQGLDKLAYPMQFVTYLQMLRIRIEQLPEEEKSLFLASDRKFRGVSLMDHLQSVALQMTSFADELPMELQGEDALKGMEFTAKYHKGFNVDTHKAIKSLFTTPTPTILKELLSEATNNRVVTFYISQVMFLNGLINLRHLSEQAEDEKKHSQISEVFGEIDDLVNLKQVAKQLLIENPIFSAEVEKRLLKISAETSLTREELDKWMSDRTIDREHFWYELLGVEKTDQIPLISFEFEEVIEEEPVDYVYVPLDFEKYIKNISRDFFVAQRNTSLEVASKNELPSELENFVLSLGTEPESRIANLLKVFHDNRIELLDESTLKIFIYKIAKKLEVNKEFSTLVLSLLEAAHKLQSMSETNNLAAQEYLAESINSPTYVVKAVQKILSEKLSKLK
jgi:hypothetical protein